MQNTQKETENKLSDYSEDAVYDRKKALLTALLKWLECEFFGLFIFLSLLGLSIMLKNMGNFLFGTLGVICYICVMADFGLKEGAKAHIKNTLRGDNVNRNFGLLIGAVAMLPALASYIIFLLSYFNILGSSVMPFKFLNLGLWGYINIFAPGADISNASSVLLWLYPITLLIYPITTHITFKIGYDNEDLQTKIMYKKQ